MMQEINLYQPMFRQQKKVFSAMTMVQVCLFFIVIFGALYIYEFNRVGTFREQLVKLDQDIAQQTAQLQKLKAQGPAASAKLQLLQKEIARLERELTERDRIQAIFEKYNFNAPRKFSAYLEALARQHVPGTWLTNVVIAGGGDDLGLEGKTFSSGLVPRYLQQLGNESALSGLSFNTMEMFRLDQEASDRLGFKVSTN